MGFPHIHHYSNRISYLYYCIQHLSSLFFVAFFYMFSSCTASYTLLFLRSILHSLILTHPFMISNKASPPLPQLAFSQDAVQFSPKPISNSFIIIIYWIVTLTKQCIARFICIQNNLDGISSYLLKYIIALSFVIKLTPSFPAFNYPFYFTRSDHLHSHL